MARVSEEDIARIREATDIVGLVSERTVLKKKGRDYWACCPFHQEKTPSFKVDPATGLWHCFGCGLGGDAFGFMMQSDNLSFIEAVTALAERAHIEITALDEGGVPRKERNRLFDVCRETAEYYHRILTRSSSDQAQAAREYLSARGFSRPIAGEWLLGYAPGHGQLVNQLKASGYSDEELVKANVARYGTGGVLRDRFFDRIMFPIHDLRGRCCAFGGRILGSGDIKYLNSNDTPIFQKSNILYGLHRAKDAIVKSGTVLVVEGYTDVIALHVAGYPNTVATLGTALTDRHVKILSRFAQRVIYVFDGDEAGQRAAVRAVEFIDETITPEATKNPVMLDVVILPSGKDPADMMATDEGSRSFRDLLDQTTPLITYALEQKLSMYDLARPEQQIRALEDAVTVLAPIKASSIATSYARDLADMFAVKGSAIDTTRVMSALEAARTPARRDTSSSPTDDPSPPQPSNDYADFYPLEVEVLGLMIANPRLRASMCSTVEANMITSEVLKEVYRIVVDAEPHGTASEILALLASSDPRLPAVFSGFDFDEASRAEDRIGSEYARALSNAMIERTIRALKAQIRQATDEDVIKNHVQEIVSLQARLSVSE